MEKLLKDPKVLSVKTLLQDDSLCLTGGAVRDQFLLEDKLITDYDFATKLTPEEVISKLEKSGVSSYFRAIRRGTVYVDLDGVRVDITTFRNPEKESEYVQTIEEDLAARDFTINAMALRLIDGQLIDPFYGRDDLEKGIVKAVGIPIKRFSEDPHRIIRLIRFSVCEGRVPDQKTWEAAETLACLVENVSWERIGAEFYKIMLSSDPVAGIEGLRKLQLLPYILPEINDCIGITQNKYHSYDVYAHTLKVLQNTILYTPEVRMAAIFHDVGKPYCIGQKEDGSRTFLGHGEVSAKLTKEALTRLKFTTSFTEMVAHLVDMHMIDPLPGLTKKAIRKIIRKVGVENLDAWKSLKWADLTGGRPVETAVKLKEEWNTFIVRLTEVMDEPYTIKEKSFLVVRGQDLIDMGFQQGKIIGDILKYLEEIVLEEPLKNDKEMLLSLVRESPYHLKIKLPLS